ncbi:MAG: DUF58 domain-containing protein [Acidimicrobiales bacterium]|nr:DUF58 domain-containing protein [Acidimicrobiales bacterium]
MRRRRGEPAPGDLPRLVQRPVDGLRGVELTVLRRIDGLLHGDYQGVLPGPGSEPGDARPYEPGDDVRRIDWPVTARTGTLHLRERVADHDLQVLVVLDLSASMDFGTARCTKRELALDAIATIGLLAARGANRTGALVVAGERRQWLPPQGGRTGLAALVHRLQQEPTGDGPTDLGAGLAALAGLVRRRGLVVVVSDFLGPPTWARPLRATAARHDVLAVEVVDPREVELPDVGFVVFSDPETGAERRVDTGRAGLREGYARAAARHRADVAAALRGAGAGHVQLRTDRDWVGDLARHLAVRRRQRLGAPARSGGTAGPAPTPITSAVAR